MRLYIQYQQTYVPSFSVASEQRPRDKEAICSLCSRLVDSRLRPSHHERLSHAAQSLRIGSATTRLDKLKRSRQSHGLAKISFAPLGYFSPYDCQRWRAATMHLVSSVVGVARCHCTPNLPCCSSGSYFPVPLGKAHSFCLVSG